VRAFQARPVDAELFPSSTIPRKTSITFINGGADDLSAIPSLNKSRADIEKGIPAYELFHQTGLCASRGEARRLIEQGGAYINENPVVFFDEKITESHINDQGLIRLRKGKKKHFLIVAK